MAEIENQTLEGRQSVDGMTYVNCAFKDAQMVFKGGTPPNFVNTSFTNSRFIFEDSAAATVHFLRAMLRPETRMRGFVTGMMPEIEN